MSATSADRARRVVRFGPFEADLRTGELTKDGSRIRLHGMPFQVLATLLERPGELVTREELRKRLWPDGTFIDYENGLNSAVARLREALNDSSERPAYVETLPKRGYRFIGPIDDGLRDRLSEGSAARSDSVPRRQVSAVPPWMVGGLVLLSTVLLLAWLVIPSPEHVAGPVRVMLAVLPFDNLSGNAADDHLSDGFTEEMITQLERVNPERFGVIARTTAMTYRGRRTDVAEIGRALRVDYVLEGSVRVGEGRLRVTAQLIRVADQTHLWAETFDRAAQNLLDVERDVSEATSRQVRLLVGPDEAVAARARPPVHPDAYDAYLRARYHHAQATVPGLESAITSYERALELDPGYALAYAGLSRAYIFGVRLQPRVALERAHAAAQKALALDPELPEAQLALAMTKLYYEWDWKGSEREFRRAIERDAGQADAHFYYSHYLAAVGRHDEAIAEARRAQALDPHSTLIGHYIGRHLYMARRYGDALAELQQTLELDPNYGWTHVFLFLTLERLGRFDAALAHRQKYLAIIGRSPDEVSDLGRRYSAGGFPAVLEKWNEVTLSYYRASGHVTSAELVHNFAALNRPDDAFTWLDRAFADHTRDLIFLNVDPGFDPLRKDPRFLARVRQMALDEVR